jgi:2-haloacid dehalogenase
MMIGPPFRRSQIPAVIALLSTHSSVVRSLEASTIGLRHLPSLNPHNGELTSLYGSRPMADFSPLCGVQACVFDAYGTLFDFASAARKVLGDDTSFITLWRDKQLQYTWLRAAQERHADFWQVTGDALDFSLETNIGLKKSDRDRLMSLFLTLDPFPEVPNVLRKLKTAGMRTAILSNGSPAMLDAAVKAAKLEPLLDAVLSVEEVGVYKPHPKVYQLAVDRLAVPASAICYQSSNAWDAYAASAFGMQVVWCNRYGQRRERLPGSPDREIGSLTQLPALVGAS